MPHVVSVVEVGGNGGEPINCDDIENGALLKKISVWVVETTVKAIKVLLTNGLSKQFGVTDGVPKEFTFEDEEYFASLSLWPNQDGTRLGAIKFKTSFGREFHASVTSGQLQPEVPVDVASGICMGIKGRSGLDIDRFGFMFLNNIKSAELTDVVYPTIHDVKPNATAIEIKSMSYQNNTPVEKDYKIEISKRITQTSSWALTSKLEFISLKVTAGIPLLVKDFAKYKLKIGVEGKYPSKFTEDEMKLFSFPVTVPPGNILDASIEIGKATVDLKFTGIIKITCYNGSTLDINTSGTYNGVAYSDGKLVFEVSLV